MEYSHASSPRYRRIHLVRENNYNFTACGMAITRSWSRTNMGLGGVNDCRRCAGWGHRLSGQALSSTNIPPNNSKDGD